MKLHIKKNYTNEQNIQWNYQNQSEATKCIVFDVFQLKKANKKLIYIQEKL